MCVKCVCASVNVCVCAFTNTWGRAQAGSLAFRALANLQKARGKVVVCIHVAESVDSTEGLGDCRQVAVFAPGAAGLVVHKGVALVCGAEEGGGGEAWKEVLESQRRV